MWYCLEVSNAVLFLWKNHIVHRDLKLDDLLITTEGFPLVCDFGKAEYVDENGFLENQQNIGGNMERLAPEVGLFFFFLLLLIDF